MKKYTVMIVLSLVSTLSYGNPDFLGSWSFYSHTCTEGSKVLNDLISLENSERLTLEISENSVFFNLIMESDVSCYLEVEAQPRFFDEKLGLDGATIKKVIGCPHSGLSNGTSLPYLEFDSKRVIIDDTEYLHVDDIFKTTRCSESSTQTTIYKRPVNLM